MVIYLEMYKNIVLIVQFVSGDEYSTRSTVKSTTSRRKGKPSASALKLILLFHYFSDLISNCIQKLQKQLRKLSKFNTLQARDMTFSDILFIRLRSRVPM